MIDVYFKRHNRAGIINSDCIGITGETEVSKEMAIELIKDKKARLALDSEQSVPFDIIKEAVGGAGAVILPNKVVSILAEQELADAINIGSSAIIIENIADAEIELDDDFIAVIEEDKDKLEMVSYIVNIREDNEVRVEYKGSKMTGCMLFNDRINKLAFKDMHSMLKNGLIVKMYDQDTISY